MNKQLDKDSVFYNKIEDNTSICKNCYRRLKTYSSPHHTLPDAVTRHVEYESHVDFDWFDDSGDSGHPSVKKSYCECGDVDGAKRRPVEKSRIMRMASRVLENLERENVEVDEDTFFSYIKTHSDNGDFKFNEEKYFEEAVNESLITNDE